ncbi:MAG: hypothetical protein R2758_12425 [Bacteroidales bacterium]
MVDSNLENLNIILASTKAMYSVGMAEATDVDQMQSTATMLENSKSSMLRSVEVNYNMLRFLLGVPASTEINLTDNIDDITASIDVDALLADEFRLEIISIFSSLRVSLQCLNWPSREPGQALCPISWDQSTTAGTGWVMS